MKIAKKIPTSAPMKGDEYSFGEWLNDQMRVKGVTIPDLVSKTGITYTGIWNIVNGYTWSPRDETRKKLASALNEKIPEDVEEVSEAESDLMSDFDWEEFPPHDLAQVPDRPGIYVFYDITDRPVYVGMSKSSVLTRVRDHSTRFWFKRPLVERASYLQIEDPLLCARMEWVLIRFLGKHALLNSKGVTRDLEE